MSTVAKGDKLENSVFQLLMAQKEQKELIAGIYPASLCKINRKKGYWCQDRSANIEFDIVIEVHREGATEPHSYVVFECKNYNRRVPVDQIEKFSKNLSSAFRHNAKGIVVTNTRLALSAENVAKNTGIAVAKICEDGLEYTIERRSNKYKDNEFIDKNLFGESRDIKPLRFAAFYSGELYGSFNELLADLIQTKQESQNHRKQFTTENLPYISDEKIEKAAEALLLDIEHNGGAVDLEEVCRKLQVEVQHVEADRTDAHGNETLGHADFAKRVIRIFPHEKQTRERFTLAHEIGHLCLGHERYIRSEPILKNDLFKIDDQHSVFSYDRLEIQANKFASSLLMPEAEFKMKVREICRALDLRNRGFGAVYVDDQPGNMRSYLELVARLSTHFNVSKEASERRLKNTVGVADHRVDTDWRSLSSIFRKQ